jgi:transcriptional regulator with XRE-family HTH domain
MSRPRKITPHILDEQVVSVGSHLQTIRKRRGLTQKRLAEKIGVTREAIAAYESGRSRLMDMTLLDLSAALRVSSDEILGLQPPSPNAPPLSRRLIKRMIIIEGLPEAVKKRILRTLDDSIKANTRLSILDD